MRRILYYSLLCLLWVSVNSCKDDEVSQPPTPSFTVDKTSGKLSDTEFTFTVEQVGAGAVSLLPYGTEKPSLGGILIPASSFSGGKATVKFTYARVGTFNAVAVSNNHNGAGDSKNSISPSTAITITSDRASLSDFSFDGSTKTEVDDSGDPVLVDITMPWSKHDKINALKLRFGKADQSTVKLGGAALQSDTTVVDYTSDKTVTVTSQDGTVSKDYVIHVIQTPAEMVTTVKSAAGIINNKGKLGDALKVATGRSLPGYVNNVDHIVVLYDTLNSDPGTYDSLGVDFSLNGSFAGATYVADNFIHDAGEKFEAKDTVDFTTATAGNPPFQFKVTAEDGTSVTYDAYVAEAPKLHVLLTNITPTSGGTSDEAFAVSIPVLGGTDTEDLDATFWFDIPTGSTIDAVQVVDGGSDAGNTGDEADPFEIDSVDISGGITLNVTVTTGDGLTFVVSYAISLAVK